MIILFVYALMILFFVVDLLIANYYHQPLTMLTVSLVGPCLFGWKKWYYTIPLVMLLCAESTIFKGFFLYPFLYLVPLLVLPLVTKNIFYNTGIELAIGTLVAIVVHAIMINDMVWKDYKTVFINLLVAECISLLYTYKRPG